MSALHLRNIGIPSNQQEDRQGLFRIRMPGSGHLGHHSGLQDTERNHTHSAIHLPLKQKPQTRGLEGYGSGSSAPQTQRFIPMEHGQHKVQTSFTLVRTGSMLLEGMFQRDTLQISYGNHQRMESQKAVQTPGGNGRQDKVESSCYPSYRRKNEPEGAYYDSFGLIRSRPTQLSSGFRTLSHQKISDQESPFFTIPDTFQENKRVKGQEQDFFQPKGERVRPNDTEAVGLGERSTQEPEIVVNTSGISSPSNRNITPTQNEYNVVTPESNLNTGQLWLQISQIAVRNQETFYEIYRKNLRFQELTTLQEAKINATKESCAKLIKTSEGTNKRLNQVFVEKCHCKRNRECLDQDINEFFNF
ncbi:hypothetical protein O181_107169 [Austropuccinia psidii MF-1]|uniref:Uncharacterized protein n=1 Tax=Austropuccinia psidii MF-1 TaxID=1389203 RepID=A0A9Q3PMS3_9BASI|nr:hypothetical protein [Austropuccinia psidii MF-1]